MVEKPTDQPIKQSSVSILLHEYDALRAEITSKMNSFYQAIAILATAAIAITGFFLASPSGVIHFKASLIASLVLVICIVAFVICLIVNDIWGAAKRIREIEEAIDVATGEWYLLRYERLYGRAVRKFGICPWSPKQVPSKPTSQPVSPGRLDTP